MIYDQFTTIASSPEEAKALVYSVYHEHNDALAAEIVGKAVICTIYDGGADISLCAG